MKPHPQKVPPKRAQHVHASKTSDRMPRRSLRPGDGDASAAAPVPGDPVKRHGLIAEAAYYRAAKRGFAVGGELGDWLEAEAEIRQLLGQ